MKPTDVEGKNKCRKCGRKLRNPRSVVAGMGPVCFKKFRANIGNSNHRGRGARYQIVPNETTLGILVIRDIGPWDKHFTVTNDADNVVAELVAAGTLLPGMRLFYYDSDGSKDEIVVKDGKFAGFKPINVMPGPVVHVGNLPPIE